MTKDGKQDGRATLAEIFAATRNADLSDSELRLWQVVRYLDRGNGCYAATETLAAELHCSPSKVEKLRAGLVVRKWLELTFRGPKEPVLRAVTPAEALQDNAELAPEESPEALHEGEELGPEALQNNEELEEGSSSPSSSPSFAQSCKQSTGSTGKETTTHPPTPRAREGSDAESGTDPPGPAPSDGDALRAGAEAGTAPPSSLTSENGRPSTGRFPSRELVELVRGEWWCGDRPPVDTPSGWTDGAECRFLERRVWPNLSNEEMRLFVRGVRLLAEADDTDLCVRDGDSEEARALGPGEGFTGALVQAWLKQNPGLPHEAVGQARKVEELQYARDGPSRTSGEGDRLRQLAEEAIGER